MVLMAATDESKIFWVVTMCSLEKAHLSVENIPPPSLGSKSKKSMKLAEAGSKLTDPYVENLARYTLVQAKLTVKQPWKNDHCLQWDSCATCSIGFFNPEGGGNIFL
jgi:hypothetical protein